MPCHSLEQPGRAKIDDQGSGKWNWWSLLPAPVHIILHRPCRCDPEDLGQNRFPRRPERPWELSAQTATRARSAALIFQRDRRHGAMSDAVLILESAGDEHVWLRTKERECSRINAAHVWIVPWQQSVCRWVSASIQTHFKPVIGY